MADEDLDNLLDEALDGFNSAPLTSVGPLKVTSGSSGSGVDRQSMFTSQINTIGEFTGAAEVGKVAAPEEPMPRVQGLAFDPLAKNPGKKKKETDPPIPAIQDENSQVEDMAKTLFTMMEDATSRKGAEQSSEGSEEDELKATIAALAEQTRASVETLDEAGDETVNEAMYQSLLQQFENLENNDEAKNMMENMMQHLLSKDVLYQPLKDISDMYPEWLQKNKVTLTHSQYSTYATQYEIMKSLLAEYDGENNFEKIVEHLQRMQDCGQPPPELVKSLSAGVEFGEDGMPKFPTPMSGDMPPDMANCTIM